eukprot:764528_1
MATRFIQSVFGPKVHIDSTIELEHLIAHSDSPTLNRNYDKEKSACCVLLLSYPRSGNHLTKAMLECLLQQPTYGYTKEKHDAKQQQIAIRNASIKHPYIRKIHTPGAISGLEGFGIHNLNKQWGLIYLIRNPFEAVISENKYVPYFWKHYEWQFEMNFMPVPMFYSHWTNADSKLIIFYEDYFNGNHSINLWKLAEYFGEKRVSSERVDYCIEHYDEIINAGLKALDRGASSNRNLHYYRDNYFGSTDQFVKVPSDVYDAVLSRYENFESC